MITLQRLQRQHLKNNTTLKFETLKTGLINEKDYDEIVDAKENDLSGIESLNCLIH